MGYDMYWIREESSPALDEARARFDAACAARDVPGLTEQVRAAAQEIVTNTYEELTRLNSETGYFRLNAGGMRTCCDIMAKRGMLCDASGPTRADWDALPPYVEDVEPVELTKLLAAHRGECPGMPAHKFGSNDGWIVTPAEIRPALLANREYEQTHVDATDSWWDEWIVYLEAAIEHGGFRVG